MNIHFIHSSPVRGGSAPVRSRNHLWQLVGSIALALLTACGGGGGVGGSGTGATATASGTVTGFGSVIVDGVRFDDSKATVSIERSAGDNSAGGVRAETKLGQQLVFSFDGKNEGEGVARSISIEPTVIGPVSAKAADGSSLTVLGRTIAINGDATLGPVTVFEPSLAAIGIGTLVEVHAIAGGTASSGLVATRVEVTTSTALRITGVVSGLSTSSGVTSMSVAGVTVLVPTAGAGAASVVPTGTTLANGQAVAVFADRLSFNEVTAALTASLVRVSVRKAGNVDDYVGGLITNFNGTARTFSLGGLTVSYRLATLSPAAATLANNLYVRVRGTLSTNGQQLEASKIQLRSQETTDGDAELHGNIVGFSAASGSTLASFTVRDVLVSIPSTVTLDTTRCAGSATFADGLYVQVKGTTTASGVTATSVKCEDEPAAGSTATVDRSGTATLLGGSNTAKAGTFTLSTAGAAIKVEYNELTFFRPRTAGTLFDGLSLRDGIALEVEGHITGTGAAQVLVATKIKQDN